MSSKASSDPVDLEKGVTGLSKEEEEEEEDKGITGVKEEEKGITGLKREGKVVHQFKHLKVLCMKLLLDVYPVLIFLVLMFMALCYYRQFHMWWPSLVLLSFAIFNFWNCRRMKHDYIQHTLAGADSDLSTTLLASSSKK